MDAYLTPSRWYMQTFGEPSPEHLFFKGDTTLKNGRMQGTMVTLDLTRPRAKPRAKRVSVHPRLDARLWRPVEAADVPEKVFLAWAASSRPTSGDKRRGRRASRSSRRPRSSRR